MRHGRNLPLDAGAARLHGAADAMFDVELVDDEGKLCQAGEVGEIVVKIRGERPVGMFLGYFKDDARTKSVWHDGVYHTLDLAWRDEWEYLTVCGARGRRHQVLGLPHWAVRGGVGAGGASIGRRMRDPRRPRSGARGQILKATIVLARGYEPSDALKKELQEHVKKTTAPYKYPRIIEFVDALPKTISNKIRRVELRERDAENSRRSGRQAD